MDRKNMGQYTGSHSPAPLERTGIWMVYRANHGNGPLIVTGGPGHPLGTTPPSRMVQGFFFQTLSDWGRYSDRAAEPYQG